MTNRRTIFYIFMLCTLLLAAACGRVAEGNNGNEPGNGETPIQEESPQLALKKGEIISVNDNSVLVTAYIDKGADSYIDAYSLRLTEKTELLHHDGTAAAKTDLAVGGQVEAWSIGPVQESYPAGANAAKLVLLSNGQSQDNISREDAVRIAYEAQTELAGPWAVKEASIDAANEFWNVELVQFQQIDQPVQVRIDAKSGEITPAPKAENDAFRVYTPGPDEELANEFTVEGEARVFEAAFSWSLEDGHFVLAEGEALAEEGAPEWGKFTIDVKFDHAVQTNMVLVLYVKSAKDGSAEHTLAIPLKVQEEYIQARQVD